MTHTFNFLAFTTGSLTWFIPLIIGVAILITYLTRKRTEDDEPVRIDTLPTSSLPVDIEPLTEAPVAMPAQEITNPDSEKPFAKLSGNKIGTAPSTPSDSLSVAETTEKPKRTYKKRVPKAKE